MHTKNPYGNAMNLKSGSAKQREHWSNYGVFNDGEYKTVIEILSHLHSTTKDNRLLLTSFVEKSCEEIKFW